MSIKMLRHRILERVSIGINRQPQGRKSFYLTRPFKTNERGSKFFRDSSNSILQKPWLVGMSSRNISKASTRSISSFLNKRGTSSVGTNHASPRHASSTSNHGTPRAEKMNPRSELKCWRCKFLDEGFTRSQASAMFKTLKDFQDLIVTEHDMNTIYQENQIPEKSIKFIDRCKTATEERMYVTKMLYDIEKDIKQTTKQLLRLINASIINILAIVTVIVAWFKLLKLYTPTSVEEEYNNKNDKGEQLLQLI